MSIEPIIITHRGLDPESPRFAESSYEAFADHLSRGFGLEFDLRRTRDGVIVISHDSDLVRVTKGRDTRRIEDITSAEFLSTSLQSGHPTSLVELLRLISERQEKGVFSAIHIKADFQNKKENLDQLIYELQNARTAPESLVLFDLKINSATYLKKLFPDLRIALSVSHPFDIERYNEVVGGTLFTLETALQYSDLFSHVWLDEWDLKGPNGTRKTLYNNETFTKLREKGFEICLVTPELHGTSPGLLGGERHEDSVTLEILRARISNILQLAPDAVCTDYPALVESMLYK